MQHKILSVRAIQKAKLLHYLLIKTRSQDKEIWRHRDSDCSKSLDSRKASRLQRTKAGHTNCFTFIITEGRKAEWRQLQNCIELHQGSEGQTRQETMHSNEYFLSSWKIRFSTSLNPTNILSCSKKESITHANCKNLICLGRVCHTSF